MLTWTVVVMWCVPLCVVLIELVCVNVMLSCCPLVILGPLNRCRLALVLVSVLVVLWNWTLWV